ncbi:MAG: hypothetical protein ACOC0Z_08140 [Halohasta sp.]
MQIYTRRRVLATAAATVAGGLAGCSGSNTTSQSSTGSEREGRGPDIPDDQLSTDPPMVVARSTSEEPPIRLSESDSAESNDDRSGPGRRHNERTLVAESDAEELTIGDDAELLATDEADGERGDGDLSAFVSATDFEAESLYLETQQVESCFRLSLCYVSWHDGIQTDYGRTLRSYDEPCAADERVTESRLIRLPTTFDGESPTSYGTGVSGSGCDWPRESEPSTGNRSTNTSGTPNASGSTGSESA